MSDLTLYGLPVRNYELTFDVTVVEWPDSEHYRVGPMAEREMRVTLQPGQRVPDTLKRGAPVRWSINGEWFVGRVRFRRLNVVVADGQFEAGSDG